MTPPAPLVQELNEPQAAAVSHGDGPLLVFAGAGSGKTRVITYRIAALLALHGVAPYRILAVTFTNRAAQEMRRRLEELVGADLARDLWVGTFHATCARLLRRWPESAGLSKNFVIYDEADQRALLARVLKELDLDDRRYPVRWVLSRIHREKQEGSGPEALAAGGAGDPNLLLAFRRYQERLREANAVDFEDLIRLVLLVAEDASSPVGRELRGRFDHVLVDEFQDVNRSQYRLVSALAAERRNLCVVGDDDQSIYRWRGADVRVIRGFRREFPEARVIKLEQNYRSTGHVVAAALGVIAPSRQREPKRLWTDRPPGDPIDVVATQSERDEAAWVVARIGELVAHGLRADEIAVFYRVHAQSRVLEEVMRARGVPYRIFGGMRFFDRAEIKDLIAYLRVLVNPASDVDLVRIINVPARGIGAQTVERLQAHASRASLPVLLALPSLLTSQELGTAARRKLEAFAALFDELRAHVDVMRPRELAARVLERTGYEEALRREDTAEADARLQNLAELLGSLDEYEAEAAAAGEVPSISGYLERVTLASDTDDADDRPRVALMTVHAAKGLEFDTVFLTGMEDDTFPFRGLDADDQDGREELEEERRLAYVAITRARRRLHVTHAASRTLFGQPRPGRPSRFLRDIPPECVRRTATTQVTPPLSHLAARLGAALTPPRRGAPHGAERPDARPPGERFVVREGDDGLDALHPGVRVRHERFGHGVVIRVEGAAPPKAIVDFRGWGQKTIVARFLEIV